MPTLQENLDYILSTVKMAVGDDIDSIRGKGNALAGILGLSSECKALAKRELELARKQAIQNIDKSLPPSVMLKAIDSECSDELYRFELADRLNASITHSLEYMRSLISLYKQEMTMEYQIGNSHT